MEKPVENYWKIRLGRLKEVLEINNFEAFIAQDIDAAQKIVIEQILPDINAQSISWGGSGTFVATGLYDRLKDQTEMTVIDTYDKSLDNESKMQRRRKALLCDIYLTGTNAVTEAGHLVNLDMIGNRVGALAFGPKHVVVLVGRNKIVSDLETAMRRIKEYSAPANAMRLNMNTPCVRTARCEDCRSPERICNTWTITEKSFPKKRIKVVLINQALGL
jgi:L-lactate utilization protein LutC